jgi:aspartyl-tRNA(Asn)/glutamyl-tRNA(Gln) amidotransferase subunit B
MSDSGEIEVIVDRVMVANPGQVAEYRGGKVGLLGFFVGQVMRETGGQANPAAVNEVLKRKLEGEGS